jgi:hypothetical protein
MKLCYDPMHWGRAGHPANQYSKDDVSFLKTPPWPLPLRPALVTFHNYSKAITYWGSGCAIILCCAHRAANLSAFWDSSENITSWSVVLMTLCCWWLVVRWFDSMLTWYMLHNCIGWTIPWMWCELYGSVTYFILLSDYVLANSS